MITEQESLERTNRLISFQVNLVSDMRSRKKALIYMRNEFN
jgi:hypothetical protein